MIAHVYSHQNEPNQKIYSKSKIDQKKQNLFKKPRKTSKKQTLQKKHFKKKQGFVSMLKRAVS